MNWQPIETAPKDHYLLGCDLVQNRPVVMIWNLTAGMFLDHACNDEDIEPGYWAELPKFDPETWNPIESAPKDSYILCYEPGMKRPYVAKWNRKKECFSSNFEQLDDETPSHWLPLSSPC